MNIFQKLVRNGSLAELASFEPHPSIEKLSPKGAAPTKEDMRPVKGVIKIYQDEVRREARGASEGADGRNR